MRHPTTPLAVVLLAALVTVPAAAGDFSGYSGAELYGRFCASCHGGALDGNGPVARMLAVAVPDLTRIAARHGGTFPDGWVYQVIDGQQSVMVHGPRDMPVWGVELWQEQGADVTAAARTRDLVARLVAFLKERQAPRRLGDPGH